MNIKKKIIATTFLLCVVFSLGISSLASSKSEDTIGAGKTSTFRSEQLTGNADRRITAKVTYIRYNGLPAGVFNTSGTTCSVKYSTNTLTSFSLNSYQEKSYLFYAPQNGTYNFVVKNNTDKSVYIKINSSFSNS